MKETALVTGASSGIGRALAREFARHGHDVVLVARREDALDAAANEFESTYDITATPIVQDLDAVDAADDLYESVQARDIDVGALVNNVGVGTYGAFHESDLDAERTQLRLNVETLVALTRHVLGDFRDCGGGKLLNVGSTAGFVPGPRMAGYYASKAYVNSFTEALAVENRDTGIDVTLLAPGPVDTEFQARADMEDSVLGTVYMADPERVAAAGYRGLVGGDTIVVPGLLMKAAYYGSRVTPRPILRRIVERVNGDR